MEPVRCFTCNAMLRFSEYEALTKSDDAIQPKDAFSQMRIPRFCCRRMYLTHSVDLEQHIRSFPLRDITRSDYSINFESRRVCTVSTD